MNSISLQTEIKPSKADANFLMQDDLIARLEQLFSTSNCMFPWSTSARGTWTKQKQITRAQQLTLMDAMANYLQSTNYDEVEAVSLASL